MTEERLTDERLAYLREIARAKLVANHPLQSLHLQVGLWSALAEIDRLRAERDAMITRYPPAEGMTFSRWTRQS